MKKLALVLLLLAPLAGCQRSLDKDDVREFIDLADDAARKRFAPEICELRGEQFTLELRFHAHDSRREPDTMQINRALYCREAGKFARLRQYQLERESLVIDIASDRKTANVVAEYKEIMPYYEHDMMPSTPDDFRDFVVVESRDESVVGIEGGEIKFLSAKVVARETELIRKGADFNLPYD
jgi:hypothetical protein